MTAIDDIDYITSDYNFETENDVTLSSGYYTFYYHFLLTNTELTASNGYDVTSTGSSPLRSIEYDEFSTTNSAQRTAFEYIMGDNTNPYSVFFTDVVGNIQFDAGTASTAQINIGQVEFDRNGNGPSDDIGVNAYAKNWYNGDEGSEPDPNYSYSLEYQNSDIHGDIWLNSAAGGGGWSSFDVGDEKFYTIMHELGHALGLKGDNDLDPSVDSQKYTMMSYNPIFGMGTNMFDALNVYGLQILDIAALQEIYGSRNFATRIGDTTYSKATAFAPALVSTNDAFIYTIWDGGGQDTISAEGFYESGIGAGVIIGAEIDLRQGAFSSIGSSMIAARATDNVAIAFHTIIENAIGSIKDDIIVGNAWDNILTGGDGDDHIYGDGLAFDGSVGFGVASGEYDLNNGDDEAPDTDNDQLYGGAGNDTLFGSSGSDTLDGGDNTDIVDYSYYTGYLRYTVLDVENYNYKVEKWDIGSDPTSDPADGTDMLYSIEMGIPHVSYGEGEFDEETSYGGVSIAGDENNNNLGPGAGTEAVSISGNGGNDSLDGHNGENDLLSGGSGDDFIQGWAGNDKLLGGDGDDTLQGQTGDDYLDGGAGNDLLQGGQGDDLYVLSGGDDTINEYGGGLDTGDTVRFQSGVELADLTFTRTGASSDVIVAIAGGDTITFKNHNHFLSAHVDWLELDDGLYNMAEILVPVYGTSANESIYGSTSLLDNGVHYRTASSIHDLIYGGGGNDNINAYHGNNVVYGGTGDDRLTGGNDSDLLYGEADDDYINGNNGNDFLYGGSGNDELFGGYGLCCAKAR